MAATPDLEDLLRGLLRNPRLAASITHWESQPARPARTEPFPASLEPRLAAVLRGRGIENLYCHQARTIEAALAGRDVTVVTPTASGKSLCFQIPVLEAVLRDPQARALLLFPTKALAQDQLRSLRALAQALGGPGAPPEIHTFDGDTPRSARTRIRGTARILLTNPDMLHAGMLPGHSQWSGFFSNLRHVVIDEVHTYRGIFGSNVANVLRRLERVCAFHRSRPVYLCCSATIANPRELTRDLIGREPVLVDDAGAPSGPRTVVFYNPPIVDPERGIRRSVAKESRRLAMRFLFNGFQTIVFARSRLRVEILTTYLRRAAGRLLGDPDLVRGYRGGYLPEERRAIEAGLRDGRLRGIVSTNALELGIDIGGLRVAILCGYPGSIASARQQIGRAGRTGESAAAIVVGSALPLDQYVVRHPEYFFGASPESGAVHPDNPVLLEGHLRCAAFELPFEDGERFGETDPRPALDRLERTGQARRTGGRTYYTGEGSPAGGISLRSASAERFLVVDSTQGNLLLGEVDDASALFLIHEGAVYIHQAETFLIDRTDWTERIAYARPVRTDYYTEPLDVTQIGIETVREASQESAGGFRFERGLGEILVRTSLDRYRKVRFETHQILGQAPVTAPPRELRTAAFWLGFRPESQREMADEGLDLPAALAGIAHLAAQVTPIFILCDRMDFRVTVSAGAPVREGDPETFARVFFHDLYPGGIGLAERVNGCWETILGAALEIVRECRCAHGCPSCVGPGAEASDRGKRSARRLLERLTGGE